MPAAAKALILGSVGAGLLLQAWLGAREWEPLSYLTAGAVVGGFICVRLFPVWGWAPLLITAYIYPVIFHATREFFTFSYYAVWLAGLLGGILAAPHPARWHLPAPWRLPLVFWALILSLGWPVIALREMNFMRDALGGYTLANSGLGGPPPVIIVTMLTSVLPQIAGIVWFDAMFAQYEHRDPGAFRRAILLPLTIGLMIGSLLAIYQWAVDIDFLSSHQWPYYKRAAGGLLDGNASGALAGLWSAAALTFALARGRLQMLIGAGVALTLWLALWATGSRMALLAGLAGIAAAAYAALRGSRGRRAWWVAGLIGGLAMLAVVLSLRARWEMDAISRTMASLPEPNRAAIAKFAEFEFWNRFGPFGTASVRMIQDSPVVGIGAGTFEIIYPDYAYVVTGGATRSHFDNAQSWYRHQLAEVGVLGSLGWMFWGAVFAVFVWKAAPARLGLTEATGVKAAVAALALMSVVSMPTRNIFVSLTFWVFAFWLVKLAGPVATPRVLAVLAQRRAGWAALWILAILFAAGTGWVGQARLRPPHRAMMADWDYLNGVSRPVQTADGVVRYTQEHGVAVFYAVPGQYVKLTFMVSHPDAASESVRVKVRQSNVQVAHFTIADRSWHDLYLKVPEDGPDRILLQMSVDRPAIGADVPARGLIVRDWEFVETPPPGASIGTEPRTRGVIFPPVRTP